MQRSATVAAALSPTGHHHERLDLSGTLWVVAQRCTAFK